MMYVVPLVSIVRSCKGCNLNSDYFIVIHKSKEPQRIYNKVLSEDLEV